jgi:hypothetical protein
MLSNLRNMLNDLETMDMDIGALLSKDASIAFKPLRENLQHLRSELRKYTLMQKQRMAEILPRIKSGDPADDELVKLLDDWGKSRFYDKTLGPFIRRDRSREVEAVGKILAWYGAAGGNMEMADFERANDVQYIFQRAKVVVMDINILSPKTLIDDFLNTNETVNEDLFWYNDNHLIAELGVQIRALVDFGHSNYDLDDRGYLLKISE